LKTAVDTNELLREIIEFLRIWREQSPSRVSTSWGTIYRDDRFPAIHQANLGWVRSLPEEGSSKILADLAAAFRGTSVMHQALLFEDAAAAYAVQEGLARQGFRPMAELGMAKVGLPACIVNPEVEIRPAVEGASADDFRSLKIATEAAAGYSREVVDQLWGFWQERAQRVGMRPFVAYLNGTPAGTISLWPRGPFAWIDDVATHPDFRLRGVARTMIFEACRRAASARCEWVLLTADWFDTPKEMYKTLGFEPVGEVRGFVRE
jgi:GNAT superfamily N-acetyltransferase